MNWINLSQKSQIEEIISESHNSPILIFKHSTRCSISITALSRLERNWNNDEMSVLKTYFLDLISYREVSNLIAETFEVIHESPQVLIIKNGKCIFNESHSGIMYDDIKQQV